MKIKIKISYEVSFLPTKRHKKVRSHYQSKEIVVNVAEVVEEDFPEAAIVKRQMYTFSGKSYADSNVSRELLSDSLRLYEGSLWRRARWRFNTAVSKDCLLAPDDLEYVLSSSGRLYSFEDDEFHAEQAIILNSTESIQIKKMESYARNCLIMNGEVWEKVLEEPVYYVMYDISGPRWHNKEGVFLIVDYLAKSERIYHTNTFSAMQRTQAERYAATLAKAMGTDVFTFGEEIIVKIPSVFSFRRTDIDKGPDLQNLDYCLKLLRMKWGKVQREDFHYKDLYNVSVFYNDEKFVTIAERNDGVRYGKVYSSIDEVLIAIFNRFSETSGPDYTTISEVVKDIARGR